MGHPLHGNGGAIQPPSGGCVLKPTINTSVIADFVQPPSGGCVLKQLGNGKRPKLGAQPPSGGCVLKLLHELHVSAICYPAAFGRLCVETP